MYALWTSAWVLLQASQPQGGDLGWPNWLQTGGTVGSLSFVIFLLLSRRLVLRTSVEERLKDQQDAHDLHVKQLAASHETQTQAAASVTQIEIASRDTRIRMLEERQAALISDRDDWRGVAKEQSEARSFAERTAEKALDTAGMASQLLDTVQTLVERRPRAKAPAPAEGGD